MGASSDIAANNGAEEMTANIYNSAGLQILKAGTKQQPVLQKKGDDVRIDWGCMYVAVPSTINAKQYITSATDALSSFALSKAGNEKAINGKRLMLITSVKLGTIGVVAKEQVFMLGYDDEYPIQYFNENLKPWWKLKAFQCFHKRLLF